MDQTIECLEIPDRDVVGWIETLRSGGFSQDEIDAMLRYLNLEYLKATIPAKLRPAFEDLLSIHQMQHGRRPRPTDREHICRMLYQMQQM